jgi:hypothetical protein
MPGYFEEDGHRAMLYVEDPEEISFEPQQTAKLLQLGLKRRRVQSDGNCYYYAAAHQLGKPAPDNPFGENRAYRRAPRKPHLHGEEK